MSETCTHFLRPWLIWWWRRAAALRVEGAQPARGQRHRSPGGRRDRHRGIMSWSATTRCVLRCPMAPSPTPPSSGATPASIQQCCASHKAICACAAGSMRRSPARGSGAGAGTPRKSIQATLGVVSALGGAWRTGAVVIHRYLQTDVLMYPGFSGGALVTMDGGGGRPLALVRGASADHPGGDRRPWSRPSSPTGRMPRGLSRRRVAARASGGGYAGDIGQPTALMLLSVERLCRRRRAGCCKATCAPPRRGAAPGRWTRRCAAYGANVSAKPSPCALRAGQLHEQSVTVGK